MARDSSSQRKPKKTGLTNLPVQLTSFIGREREIAEVSEELANTRLLTLTGPGGCGKTRLALQVAASQSQAFKDGACWVELAPILDPGLVPQTIAKAVGVLELPNQPLVQTLSNHLQSKHLLLILDNCEHLAAACGQLAESLLRVCPKLKVIATTREALDLAGETTWLVPSLSLPESGSSLQDAGDLPALMNYDAIRLFVERATSVLPAFRLTKENGAAVVEVCRRLDGIPLAIELAAARVTVLNLQQIAARLDDRFNLLTAGQRATLPRHQTLRAAIDWSHELLAKNERMLFRRLAVFWGGLSLETAEAVCAESEDKEARGQGDAERPAVTVSPGLRISVSEVLLLLSNLIDKSLVIADTQRGDEARYHMLETIREYAAEKLEAARETARIRERHLGWFLRLAEEAEAEWRGPDQAAWLDRAELEHENLRAALKWCKERGAVEEQLRIAAALLRFWIVRGYLSEGREWLEKALPQSASASEVVRAKALHVAGTLAHRQSDWPAAREFLEQALALRRGLQDQGGISTSLNNLAAVTINQGDYARAHALLEESIAIKRQLGDKIGLAYSLGNLGEVARNEGDYAQASALYEESLALLRELDDKDTVAMVLVSLASLHHARGDYARAEALFRESLAQAQQLGNKWASAMCLAGLAAIARVRRKPEHAARLLGAAQARLEAIGSPLGPADRAEYERNVAGVRALLDEATFKMAWAEGRAMTVDKAIEYASTATEKPLPATAQTSLRVLALGAVSIYRGDHLLTSADWTYAKAKELLLYLLSHDPRTKEQIGADMWPEASPAQLRNSFNVTVHHLRRALGKPEWVVFEDGYYRFNRTPGFWYDVEAFEAGLGRALQLQTTARLEAIEIFRATLQLYRGDFLQDLDLGEWYIARREELRRTYLEGLLNLGQLLLAEGKYADAEQVLRQATARDPYFEEAHRELMRCYAAQGELSRALRHYRMVTDLLREELGGQPAPETSELYRRLRRGARE